MNNTVINKIPFYMGEFIIAFKKKELRLPGRIDTKGNISVGKEVGETIPPGFAKKSINIQFEIPTEYLQEFGNGNVAADREFNWPWPQTTAFWKRYKRESKIVDLIYDTDKGRLTINLEAAQQARKVVVQLETRFTASSTSRLGIKEVHSITNENPINEIALVPKNDYFKQFSYNLGKSLSNPPKNQAGQLVVIVDSKFSDEYKTLESSLIEKSIVIDKVIEKNAFLKNEHASFDLQIALSQYSTNAITNDIIIIIEKPTDQSTDQLTKKLHNPVLSAQVATLKDSGIKTYIAVATDLPIDGGKLELFTEQFIVGQKFSNKVLHYLDPFVNKNAMS